MCICQFIFRMEISLSKKSQEIENRTLTIIRELELQSLRQEIDYKESELLARELGRLLQRIRRSSNITIETTNG